MTGSSAYQYIVGKLNGNRLGPRSGQESSQAKMVAPVSKFKAYVRASAEFPADDWSRGGFSIGEPSRNPDNGRFYGGGYAYIVIRTNETGATLDEKSQAENSHKVCNW